ncbi:MAG: PAS domain S-box protein [Mucilaginibacter polytrichastri]|nr:PAS domain S-box protein [Mucilaginibacter polytrichastri]
MESGKATETDKDRPDTVHARLKEALAELEELRAQLEEKTDIIEAIRGGQVDALIVNAPEGHQLYSLESADISYRIFVEEMAEGAITLNTEGIIIFANSRFSQWLNVPLEEVIGKNFLDFVSPQDLQAWSGLFDTAWQRNIRGEISIRSAGQELPVFLSLKVLSTAHYHSMSVIISDLSEQKNAQRQLREKNRELEEAQKKLRLLNTGLEKTVADRTRALYNNEQRLSSILETMAEGVGIVDRAGQLTYANPMAQQILGLKESEILTRTYDDPKWQNLRIDGTPLPPEEHPIAITLATGNPVYDFEIGVQPPDRDVFYISINAAAVRNEEGEIVAGIGTFMDVTNRRKITRQKDEFISVASHELRTPITTLKASLQLMLRMKDSPDNRMFPTLIEQANKSLNKVSVLVDDLLNVTKITEGKLDLNRSRFIIADLINECCQHTRNEEGYTVTLKGNAQLEVDADADKIEQVLVNFLNNAVKYAYGSKSIDIDVEQHGNLVKISVTDYGPGIPAEKLPFLFERYYRVDVGGHQYSGLGLGLYISSEIVHRHGGKIGVESSDGVGSTFWFTLPLPA